MSEFFNSLSQSNQFHASGRRCNVDDKNGGDQYNSELVHLGRTAFDNKPLGALFFAGGLLQLNLSINNLVLETGTTQFLGLTVVARYTALLFLTLATSLSLLLHYLPNLDLIIRTI